MTWSNLVWGGMTAFVIAVELLGYFKVGPWRTLSETIWLDENQFHVIYLLVGSFLCGLTLHFLSRIPFWHAIVLGLVVGVISHLISGWPKW